MSAYIEENTKKVAPNLSRYPEWWLFFVDYIGQDNDATGKRAFLSSGSLSVEFLAEPYEQ